MQASEQGVGANSVGKAARYQIVPRTLIFVISVNPVSGGEEMLLIKAHPTNGYGPTNSTASAATSKQARTFWPRPGGSWPRRRD